MQEKILIDDRPKSSQELDHLNPQIEKWKQKNQLALESNGLSNNFSTFLDLARQPLLAANKNEHSQIEKVLSDLLAEYKKINTRPVNRAIKKWEKERNKTNLREDNGMVQRAINEAKPKIKLRLIQGSMPYDEIKALLDESFETVIHSCHFGEWC